MSTTRARERPEVLCGSSRMHRGLSLGVLDRSTPRGSVHFFPSVRWVEKRRVFGKMTELRSIVHVEYNREIREITRMALEWADNFQLIQYSSGQRLERRPEGRLEVRTLGASRQAQDTGYDGTTTPTRTRAPSDRRVL